MKEPNVEGTYFVTCCGWFGDGTAHFRLANGRVTGADIGGGTYDGDYQWNEHTCSVDLDVDLRVLFPNILVPDGKVRVPGDVTKFRIAFPWHTLGEPFAVNLPYGPVMLTVQRTGDVQPAALEVQHVR